LRNTFKNWSAHLRDSNPQMIATPKLTVTPCVKDNGYGCHSWVSFQNMTDISNPITTPAKKHLIDFSVPFGNSISNGFIGETFSFAGNKQ
jgi:hypothetical protein